MKKQIATLTVLLSCFLHTFAEEKIWDDWQYGAVIDGGFATRKPELSYRDKGLGFGHSDLMFNGSLGQHFRMDLVAGFHSQDQKIDTHWDQYAIETKTLPFGLQAKAGRFPAQIGYLNEQHPHADDFAERPLLYRSFFGTQWNDNGLRLTWTLPTPFYLRLGAEVFTGKQLVKETSSSKKGVAVLSLKAGDDINTNQSWQMGLAYLHNRREAVAGETHAEGEAQSTSAHVHGAQFSGKNMWVGDMVWKWSPQGNNHQQQVKLVGEFAYVSDINRFANGESHNALSLGAVWRFTQNWEIGARADSLKVDIPEEEIFHKGKLKEYSAMVAYKPSHKQIFRMQYSHQDSNDEFPNPANHALLFQYVISIGGHPAHLY